MKVVKVILYIFLALALIYGALCLMGPKRLDTKRSTTIAAPAGVIHNQINDLNNWQNWSPWLARDTSMVTTYGEKTMGVGGNYSWTSGQGNGSLEIIESSANAMKTKLLFEGWDEASYGDWTLEESDDGNTNVTWGMSANNDNPFLVRGMLTLMGMTKQLETDFEAGLAGIKEIAEKENELIKAVKVTAVDVPEVHYIMNRSKISIEGLQKFYEDNFTSMYGAAIKLGGPINGMPSSVFYDWKPNEGITDVGAAIPLSSPVTIGDYENVTIPQGKALVVDHYGPYHTVGTSHWALDAYMKTNNLEYKGPTIEEYANDPTTVTEDKIHTRITYYVN